MVMLLRLLFLRWVLLADVDVAKPHSFRCCIHERCEREVSNSGDVVERHRENREGHCLI